ncbi:15085_t:CDS:2 [Gigaspora margarita]|uniref:15085_t:CDS:1 n=1 Tax=Gigaspora margarita TaxID=4874 RepID=A0ABN7UCN4_GIGMA|nr:15085_t:CDS:2 [Gigaspora margarita]
MPINYPEECPECNGYCLYARFARRKLQPLTLNGPQHSRVNEPDQFSQYPCISRPDQPLQINEINNFINDLNYILAEPNLQIQYSNNQTTNSIRNNSIQPPLNPMQANIQINNNLQRQPSFASQVSNVTVQPLQEFRNCNCLVCSILKNQCFQSIGDEPWNENCVTQNEQNEEVGGAISYNYEYCH